MILLDNGSTDGSCERVASAFPHHEILRLPGNLGYAAAVNRGIERALTRGFSWVWLLNSDIELPACALASLRAAAEADRRAGMAAPVLVEADGAIQAWGGGRINLRTGMLRHCVAAGQRCDYLSGACLLLRAAMLREVGLLDESYFFYWEDVDLSLRARRAGWRLAVAPDCTVVHREGSTLGRWSEARWYFLFLGMKRFLRSHAPMPRSAALLRLLHHSATMAARGRPAAVRGAWRALWGGRALPSAGPAVHCSAHGFARALPRIRSRLREDRR